MKNIIIAGFFIAAVCMLSFTSCKKSVQIDNKASASSQSNSKKLSAGEIKCKKYLELIHQKTRTNISIDSAVIYLEGSLNYVYVRQYNYFKDRFYFHRHYGAENTMYTDVVGSLYDDIVSDLSEFRAAIEDDDVWPGVIDVSLSPGGGIDIDANFLTVVFDSPDPPPGPSNSESYKNTDDAMCSGTAPFTIFSNSSAASEGALWYWDQYINWNYVSPGGAVFPLSITQVGYASIGTPIPNPNWVGSNPYSPYIQWVGSGSGSNAWTGECMASTELSYYAYTINAIITNYYINTSTSPVYNMEYLGQHTPNTWSTTGLGSPDDYMWFGGSMFFGDYVGVSIPPTSL